MALKDRLRNQRCKRFENVMNGSHSKSQERNFASFDCESGIHFKKNKVREEFSTKETIKESDCTTTDSDHIYSSARSETVYDSIKRKMSEEICEKPVRKKCFSKNAIMARLNRERKKKYVSSLEIEKESLLKENNEINRKLEEQNKKISAMRHEILYLKGLLSNSKEIGQILRSLKETTRLPVTSSLISSTPTGIEKEFSVQSSANKQDNHNLEDYQPRIRSVNSGYNFPIIDKDINLGSCSDDTQNDTADLEDYPFGFENNSYDISPTHLNYEDSFFNFTNVQSELEFGEFLKLDDVSEDDHQVGICLHVNQKKISVEVCSICNSKAKSLLEDLQDEVF